MTSKKQKVYVHNTISPVKKKKPMCKSIQKAFSFEFCDITAILENPN